MVNLCSSNAWREWILKHLFLWLFCVILIISPVTNLLTVSDPGYVHGGDTLTLVCQSLIPDKLSWTVTTAGTTWQQQVVVPGPKYTIQTFGEEPSGITRSTLIRTNATLSDRGTYSCSDATSSFDVYVTVIYISGSITEAAPLTLDCSIVGFASNPPQMNYDWFFNGDSLTHLSTSLNKYNVTFINPDLILVINKPTTSNVGFYICSFTLPTDSLPVTFNTSILVNGTYTTSKADSIYATSISIIYFNIWSLIISVRICIMT